MSSLLVLLTDQPSFVLVISISSLISPLYSDDSDNPDVVAQAGLVSQHNLYVSLSTKDAT